MPPVITLILLVLSFCCFAISAWQWASPIWNRLVSVGLATYVLSLLLAA